MIEFPEKLECLFQPSRYKILYGGRGATKSWGVARALLIQGATKPLRILCAREIQRTIADSVHRLLADQIVAMGLESFYRVLDTEIVGINGTEFAFAGLRQQDVHKIKSFEGVDVCWVEEAHTVTAKSWDVLIPTIRKEGSEIWVTFNPELDTDETYQRFVVTPPPNAIVLKLTYADNPWFPETLEQERQTLRARDLVAYDNVWEGKPRSVVEGAIYASEIAKVIEDRRLRPVPYDPMLRVHTIWDLGWGVTAIGLAQRMASELRIIGYYELSGTKYPDDIARLERLGYRWGTDFLPHDARHGNKHTGKSPEETLLALGRKVQIVPDIGIENGIAAARLAFSRCYFDDSKVEKIPEGHVGVGRLFECLKRYKRIMNSRTGHLESPDDDEYAHGADMFRYLAVIADKMKNDSDSKPLPKPNTKWVV